MSIPGMNPLLRDVLAIPDKIDASDFVLQLHAGVEAAERTLQDYVVTPAIAESLDEALGLVERTIAGGKSKGAFVHGSFGAGKSHFMAVLHLLLTGNRTARTLKGLQGAVARHSNVLGKNLLAVDYHLLGKESFEGALFAGYLETVSRLHPDAKPPVLHKSEALFQDAIAQREQYGDDAFFNALGGASDGWGDFGAAWTPETFEAALVSGIGSAERTKLAQDLIAKLFTGYTATGEWLEISEGLKAMTEHAASLKYDGLILFLDELVLWLGQHLSDTHFIQNETSKVAKLVETEMGSLPVPIVSFVARQRDLKDFLGGGAIGAEQVALGQSFQWWEERFETIALRAADLPQIVHQRLLMPVDAAGERAIASALSQVKANPSAWGYLLTDEAGSNEVDFGLVYPFSPALADALIALSSLMQRERTALKLMGELLVEGRDELTVSDVIPVGDLFDVVVLGNVKPLTEDMKRRFANAETFYRSKMRPYLLNKHHLSDEQADAALRTHAFRTEDRLAKTLLIAEIAPGATSLRNLTAAKLAALNFGTISTFIPGQEATQVLTWVNEWTREFGEVSVGQGNDPLISIHLSGVDYDSVIERVQHEDTTRSRQELLRNILSEELGLPQQAGLIVQRMLTHTWRGTKRQVDVLFGNVRDPESLSDEALRAVPGHWQLAIDFPFDDPNHSPSDDLLRLQQLREQGLETETIAWIPHFFTAARMEDVGRLVLLEYVLHPTRFGQNASHLPVGDREPARAALENRRRGLRDQILTALRQAYGVQTPSKDNVEVVMSGADVFSTLYPGLSIQPPPAVTLRQGFAGVLDQVFAFQYPDHPAFEPSDVEVRRSDLNAVLTLAREVIALGGRVEGVERAKQTTLKRIAPPLGVGTPLENVYALSQATFSRWGDFTQWVATDGTGGEIKVASLRARLEPIGMPTDIQDLLILVWAALDDREWLRLGTKIPDPGIGSLSDDMILRSPRLPSISDWERAADRAEKVFGVTRERHRSAASVGRLSGVIRAKASAMVDAARTLVTELEKHAVELGLDIEAVIGRLATARVGVKLLDSLRAERDDTMLVEVLSAADLPAEPQPLGKSLASAGGVVTALQGMNWEVLERAVSLKGGLSSPEFAGLSSVAQQEEAHSSLAATLRQYSRLAQEIVLGATPPPVVLPSGGLPSMVVGPVDVPTHIGVDDVILDFENTPGPFDVVAAEIRAALLKAPEKKVHIKWCLE